MLDGTGRYGRVVVVGASSEIARATLAGLDLAACADVLLLGRDVDRTRELAPGLRRDVHVRVGPLDLRELSEDPQGVCGRWFAEGDVDLLIPAFGILGDQQAAEADPTHAVEVLSVNLVAQVALLLECARRMRLQGHGTLVVFSSVAAVRGRRANFVYGASKAGLDAFTCGLTDSLAGSGVGVLLVRPGFVVGRMTEGLSPAPLASTPEQVGAAVVQALDRGRASVWVPPAVGPAAIALRLVPRPLWRRIRR